MVTLIFSKSDIVRFVKIGFSVILFVSIFVFICGFSTKNVKIKHNSIIVIDAGHGGEDGGAVADDGTNEKDINLKIALQLEELFKSSGFDTVMTRNEDIAIYDDGCDTIKTKKVSDMHNRLEIFNENENNIVISIHQNKFEQKKYNGTQVFYSPNNEKSEQLAENIRLSVTNMLQPDNSRELKKADKNIYLLYNCTNPSVIVECGFISNNEELEKLKTDDYQKQMAFSIYCGCVEYINSQK